MSQRAQISWRAYPALLTAGVLAVGIVVAGRFSPGFWVWAGGASVSLLLAAATLIVPRRRLVTLRPLLRLGALGLVISCSGAAFYTARQMLPEQHVARHLAPSLPGLAPPQVTVEGRVVGAPSVRPYGQRFTLEARRIVAVADTERVTGRVQVTLTRSPWRQEDRRRSFPDVAVGDLLRIRGAFKPVPQLRNPLAFDYGAYLRRRGIHVTLTTYDPAEVVRFGRDRSLLDRMLVPARRYVKRQIDRYISTPDSRIIVRALLLGDRSGLAPEVRERFVRTGLMHLLAVSGLHVLLVGLLVYRLLRPLLGRLGWTWRRVENVRAALTMVLLIGYMLLTGAQPPVVRAVVMAGIFIGGALVQRPVRTLNMLGVAAVILLVARPSHLFDAGFQLSFAAVAGIVMLHPGFRRIAPARWQQYKSGRWLVTSLSTSLAAILGTAPVVLYHFGYLSLAGLLLNVPAIPLTGVVLAAAIVTVVLGGWAAPLAAYFGAATNTFTRLLLWTVRVGDELLGWTGVYLDLREGWEVLAFVAALVMLALWARPRLRWRWAVALLVMLSLGVWGGILRDEHAPALEVLFFDVGQGDAALVALPNGKHVLIDTGPRTPFSSATTRTLLPYLRRRGIRRLDVVVISHTDRDHAGGLPALLRALPVGRVVRGTGRAETDLYVEVRHVMDSLGVPERVVTAGDTLRLGFGVQARVLAPPFGIGGAGNAATLVLHLAYGASSVLFLGDAERRTEQYLVTHYPQLLPADLIKVGHHGSSTSSTPGFVRAATADTAASFAVVSVGRDNAYGLPSPNVLQRWRSHGTRVFTTGRVGAVWFRSDGRRFEQIEWR